MSKTVSAAKDRQLDYRGYSEMVGTVSQEYLKASTHTLNNETDEFNAQPTDNAKDLLERICARENMEQAMKRVQTNKGAGGVDGMSADELHVWLAENYEALTDRLLTGRYKPRPVRRVEIPKEEKGKTRTLGIPTVADRMVQQAIVQVLTPIYEPKFSPNSFGFRPNHSAHDALLAIKTYADAGNVWVASIDLERFFDTVNQSKLVQLLSDSLVDKRVVSLIHRFLMAGVMEGGVVHKTEKGTPQGGPLSPLLANILLNELDRELELRGHVFVRYADDCMILKRTRKAAERALVSVSKFIEDKLFLKVNKDKSFVAHISDNVKYLGYGFSCEEGKLHLRVHPTSITKLKDKVRIILARSNGWALDYRRYRLRCLVNGWVNYFKLAHMKSLLARVDGWMRRKIRCVYWKAWKKNRTKFRALQKLGIARYLAWQWANSRKSYWRIAGSGVLTRALTIAKLEELGWTYFSRRYQQVGCQG